MAAPEDHRLNGEVSIATAVSLTSLAGGRCRTKHQRRCLAQGRPLVRHGRSATQHPQRRAVREAQLRHSSRRSPLGACGWSREPLGAIIDNTVAQSSLAAAVGEQPASQSVCDARRALPSTCDAGVHTAPVLISRPSTALSDECGRAGQDVGGQY